MEEGKNTILRLRGCGGATNNALWKKIISNITGKPIVLTSNSDNAGILGSAIIAAVGSGVYKTFEDACSSMTKVAAVIEPDMAEYEMYEPYYQKYLRLYEETKQLFTAK
jgi:sugar (pentulose or hexulose) kinase